MKLEQLLEGVPFTLVQGSLDTEVQDIIYDSRKDIRLTATGSASPSWSRTVPAPAAISAPKRSSPRGPTATPC